MSSILENAREVLLDRRERSRQPAFAGDRRMARRLRIDAALARLDAGTYGVCVACGCTIEPSRLEEMPETELCADCSTA